MSSPKIQLLSPVVRNQIAAGEVVERPASIIKELIENSIDALASKITVQLKNGGRDYIRIKDNGHGMTKENLVLACERHTTSKIQNTEDLHNIQSYGFRGEALASITSVAVLRIKSKHESESTGHSLQFSHGEKTDETVVAMENGTDITIENLFETLPARKKFLKTKATEYSHCVKILQDMALMHPDIHFEWSHDSGSPTILPATTLQQRIQHLFPEHRNQLIPVEYNHEDISLSGYISKPGYTVSSRDHQRYFVNERPISDRTLSAAVLEGYHSYIAKGSYPAIFLFIQMHPHKVDINVHPRKTEVRFSSSQEIYAHTLKAIQQSIQSAAEQLASPLIIAPFSQTSTNTISTQTFNSNSNFSGKTRSIIPQNTFIKQSPKPHHTITPPPIATPLFSMETHAEKKVPYTVIGQVGKGFIVCEYKDGMFVFDQHALHERARYNILIQQYEEKSIPSQSLLFPLLFESNEAAIAQIIEKQEIFETIGFSIHEFDSKSIQVSALPSIVKENQAIEIIDGLIQEYQQGKELRECYEKALTFVACRSAVMFGDELQKAEMEGIIALWLENGTGMTCPHGRPVGFEVSRKYMESQVGR